MSDFFKIVFAIFGFIVAFILNNYSLKIPHRVLSSYNTSPVWNPPVNSKTTHHTLPVIYLTINEQDFFSYYNGIYVRGKQQFLNNNLPLRQKWWNWPGNYHLRGNKSERNIYFTYTNNTSRFYSQATVKIQGNKTRSFPQKSLSVKFTDAKNTPGFFYNTHKTYILRNSGNDWGKTLFADALAHQIMSNTELDVQPYKHVVVYLNNEYWGIHNLTVKTDEHFLAKKYNCKKKKITIIESDGIKSGSNDIAGEYFHLINKLQSSMYKNAQKYALIKNEIDLDKFNTYIIFQVYFANTDWPHNNVRIYKIKSKNINTKWTFIPYDMDYSFAFTGTDAVKKDMFQHLFNNKNNHVSVIFTQLMQNKNYRSLFRNKFEYYLSNVLSVNYQIHILDSISNTLLPEMNNHINRWRKPNSLNKWSEYVNSNRAFILNREKYIRMHLNKYFN